MAFQFKSMQVDDLMKKSSPYVFSCRVEIKKKERSVGI